MEVSNVTTPDGITLDLKDEKARNVLHALSQIPDISENASTEKLAQAINAVLAACRGIVASLAAVVAVCGNAAVVPAMSLHKHIDGAVPIMTNTVEYIGYTVSNALAETFADMRGKDDVGRYARDGGVISRIEGDRLAYVSDIRSVITREYLLGLIGTYVTVDSSGHVRVAKVEPEANASAAGMPAPVPAGAFASDRVAARGLRDGDMDADAVFSSDLRAKDDYARYERVDGSLRPVDGDRLVLLSELQSLVTREYVLELIGAHVGITNNTIHIYR